MLGAIVLLAVVALVVFLFRAERRSKIIYRRKVADSDRSYFVSDQPKSSSQMQDYWFTSDAGHETASADTFAFGGGEFGGGGAGESHEMGTDNDWGGAEFSGEFATDPSGDFSSDFSSDTPFGSSGSDSFGSDSPGSNSTTSSND
ncbi:hypothetical protein LZD49_29645 [Dyadobacter sp. CY261]|uniref:hypothetical protein n=1 Tax=Dyadobacter sp. CY261 TaxID=2907203 RepID=UPI001F1C836B|nr:hypothetical protein [Dyadobacter sp. CY261]MCF0074686.1 hypothetical protein [Dyadobacter sp. CY261]